MHTARAVVGGLALAATTIGVAVALVAYGRVPTWDELGELPNQMLTDTTVFILLTLLAWAAWAVFTLTVLAEALAELTGNRSWRLPGDTPIHTTARRLVATITMGATLGPLLARGQPAPVLAAPPAPITAPAPAAPPTAVAPAAPTAGHMAPAPAPAPALPTQARADPEPELPTVTVAVGDSPWWLAERHLGQGLRWREIWDLNRGTPQPDGRAWIVEDLIHPGWHLRLPVNATNVPTDPAPTPEPPEAPAPAPTDQDPARTGDDQTVGHETGGGGEGPAVATDDCEPGTTSPADLPAPSTTPSTTPSDASPPPPADERSFDESPTTPAIVLGITGATVVATGLAFEIRRRRRRRIAPSARVTWGADSPEHRATEHAIATASDLPLIRWAGHHLAALPDNLMVPLPGAPVALELADDTGAELLWDAPNPDATSPWTAADNGWAWRLAYDPDAEVPGDDQPAGIPGLVTIGHRNGRQLLVDLEAFGSMRLVGHPDHTADLARAIVYELGTSDELASAQVVLADVEIDGADQLPRIHHDTADDALRRLQATVADVEATLDETKSPSTFDYRRHGWIDTTVVVVDAENPLAGELVTAARARRGVATIVVGHIDDTGAQITVRSDGTAELFPYGITFQPAALPASTASDVTHLLDTLDDPPEPLDPDDDPTFSGGAAQDTEVALPDQADEPVAESAASDEPIDTGDDAGPVMPEILVKVLGTPHVPTRPRLKRRELSLVVYLASKGQPTPAASVQHAVWGGRAVQPRTMWNVATATRAALGHLSDGRPAMPASRRAHNTLAVDPAVRTDLQVLGDLYEQAQQVPSTRAIDLLQQGLDLIEGQPFDGDDFDWAHHTELLVAHATRLIEAAADELVQLAVDAGRIDLARHAITQALRALPGNEAFYRARMTIEHGQGNFAAIRAAYEELVSFLADIDASPSPATADLYRRLRPRPGRQAS